MSPTQRTLAWLRKDGYTAAITERWNQHAKIRQDLFGFIDVVAVREGETIGVQATSGSNTSSRVEKIRGIEAARTWLLAGNRILVVGWRKLVQKRADGKRGLAKRWEPKIVEVMLSDLPSSRVAATQEPGTPET